MLDTADIALSASTIVLGFVSGMVDAVKGTNMYAKKFAGNNKCKTAKRQENLRKDPAVEKIIFEEHKKPRRTQRRARTNTK